MNVLLTIKNHLENELFVGRQERILVAVSGGVDSVCLVRMLSILRYTAAIAHVNYGLRGIDSDKDEIFVKKLAEELQIPFYSKKIPLPKDAPNLQAQARMLRYAWLDEIKNQYHFHKIATAHHADDQIETAFMRIFLRGAGIKAITGMQAKNGDHIRPLLSLRKSDLLAFSAQKGWDFREDISNLSLNYDRNIVRNQILPTILSYFKQSDKTLLHNIVHWQQTARIQDLYFNRIVDKKVKREGNTMYLPINYLTQDGIAKSILWHYLEHKKFSFSQIDEVCKLFRAKNGKYVASESHRCIKHERWLLVSPIITQDTSPIICIEKEGLFSFGDQAISIEKGNKPKQVETSNPKIQWIALEDDSFPLVLRRPTMGDYFYPLGMNKQKKLSRFFIDQKISTLQREKVWVLCTDKKIIWIAGLRIDNRFKITDKSKSFYKLTLH